MPSRASTDFPSPVGGIPYPIDFAPSILFAVLYGLLLPITAWRIANSRTRNLLIIGTMLFGIERVVCFSLRAYAAHSATGRANKSIETYFQASYSGGFISIALDLVNLMRSLVVDVSLGSTMRAKYLQTSALYRRSNKQPSSASVEAATSSERPFATDNDDVTDHPRIRFWARTLGGYAVVLFYVILGLSLASGGLYQETIDTGTQASVIQQLRYASTGLALFFIVCITAATVWAYLRVPRLPRNPPMWVILIAFLLSIVSIYRLVVMRFWISSLSSTAPGSQNSRGDKAAFYVLHIVPEYIAISILVVMDVRKVFRTGMWGDVRGSDPEL